MTTTSEMHQRIESSTTRASLAAAAAVAVVLLVATPGFAQTKRPVAAADENQKALVEEVRALRAQVERLQKTVDEQQERRGVSGKDHPPRVMGGGEPAASMPDASQHGAGKQGMPGMKEHMDDMQKHMEEMHGGGAMGSSPPTSTPTAPQSHPSGGMGHM